MTGDENWLNTGEQAVVRREAEARLHHAHPRGQRQAILALVGLEMGLRISEIARLRLEHFNVPGRRARVVRLKKQGPGYRRGIPHSGATEETVPMTDRMAHLIETLKAAWGRSSGPLFVNARIGFDVRPVSARTLRLDWQEFLAAIGLPSRGTHALRRTFATEVADRTDSVLAVNHALGHSPKSIECDLVYIRRNPKRLERAMAQLYRDDIA